MTSIMRQVLLNGVIQVQLVKLLSVSSNIILYSVHDFTIRCKYIICTCYIQVDGVIFQKYK